MAAARQSLDAEQAVHGHGQLASLAGQFQRQRGHSGQLGGAITSLLM
jgi:hypothetical protein